MHMLFAAATLSLQHNLLDVAGDLLEAYPTLANGHPLLDYLTESSDRERIVMLDSGAFSAWTKGDQVPIDSYIKFCHDYGKLFSCFVNVDVIPGKWGEIPSPEQVEESAGKGWDNFMYMLDGGLPSEKVVHVFHQNENFKWLEKLVELNDALVAEGGEGLYIGLSPANDRTTKQKIMWLEQCMPYVTNPDGSAHLRWHGFGVTSFPIMARFPWYTVDSTSWMRSGTFGSIHIPKNPKRYVEGFQLIAVTPDSAVSQGARHIGALSERQREEVAKYVSEFGHTLEDVANEGRARNIINLKFYQRVTDEINAQGNKWKKMQNSFI